MAEQITIIPSESKGYQNDVSANVLYVGNVIGYGNGYATRFTITPSKAITSLSLDITRASNWGLTSNNVTILAGVSTSDTATRPSSSTACTIGGTEGSTEAATLSVSFDKTVSANATVYLWLWTTSSQQAYLAIKPTASGGSRSAEVSIKGTVTTYPVSYNANGHGTAPASQTKTYGTNLTLRSFIANQSTGGSSATATITGNNSNGDSWSGSNGSAGYVTAKTTYTQSKWNTKSDGTGTNYNSQGTYTANASATMYAIWGSSTVAAYGTSYTLPTGTPVKNNTTSTRTVTINANGGSSTISSRTSTSTTTYTFKGWYTAETGGTKRTTSSRVTASETVYSQFGSSTSGYTAVTLPTAAQCTRPGYELLGFSTSSSATTATYLPGASYTPNGDVTLYAVWKILGLVEIGNGSGFDQYEIYIGNGSSFDRYIAYIGNGSGWDQYK